jgi:hypothetical protein
MILVRQDPEPDDDEVFDGHTVFELSGEVRVLMEDLLEGLGDAADATVTATDLAGALRSLREQDGVVVELDNHNHIELLVDRLAEMKGGPIF